MSQKGLTFDLNPLPALVRGFVLDCFPMIEYELEHAIEQHSKSLIVSNIELFLNYCVRFYDHQFITRDNVHKGILERFENLLNEYFKQINLIRMVYLL